MSNKKLMLGNEAFARGAYEAGVKVSAAYPGTPSTEISENVVSYEEIYAEWSPNEKVAMEVAIGASISGVRALVCMKHVGVNVAADPLFTCSYSGVNGGLVLIAADDPGLYSSQNEQDTRSIGRAAKVPVIEPADSQEAKEFVKFAFDMSEKYDTPVIVRSTTRLSHSQGIVELNDRINLEDKPYVKNIAKNVMIPSNAKTRHLYVEKRMNDMIEDSPSFPINKVEYQDKSIGIITSGIPYQYVKEVLPNASVLKLGLVNPLPRKMIEDFAKEVETLYVVEELDPIIEEQVKSWGIKVIGKEIFTVQGEYSANMIRKAILGMELELEEAAMTPARPAILCPGCPHRSVFSVLNKLKIHAAGDIGCYTLGAAPPLSVIDTTVCMGASISTLHGMEKAKGKEYTKDWVAVIGDSTFLHTGINSLINMVYNKSTSTVMILDNSITAMTGHQEHAGTGKTLKGEPTYSINLYDLCKAVGVTNVVEVNAFDLVNLERIVKEETKKDELSVIIVKDPCVLLTKKRTPMVCKPIEDKCKKCGACLKPGCSALTKKEDGTIAIDDVMCNDCKLCMQLCKFHAIEEVTRNE